MIFSTSMIVSNSDMIKNYKTCRDKAEVLGKIFILKNNQPDAVLFSISEYERVSSFMEYLEHLEETDVAKLYDTLPEGGIRMTKTIEQLRNEL
jgi:PHD/YefM family antitoxin component YafN of YafNO toxin-antitoxin module